MRSSAVSHFIAFVLGVFIGAAMIEFVLAVTPNKPEPAQCLTMKALIEHPFFPGEVVLAGESQICGKGLYITGIYGPSIEEWRKSYETPRGKQASR